MRCSLPGVVGAALCVVVSVVHLLLFAVSVEQLLLFEEGVSATAPLHRPRLESGGGVGVQHEGRPAFQGSVLRRSEKDCAS